MRKKVSVVVTSLFVTQLVVFVWLVSLNDVIFEFLYIYLGVKQVLRPVPLQIRSKCLDILRGIFLYYLET